MDLACSRKMFRVFLLNAFMTTADNAYDTVVAMAAPMGPYSGMSTRLRRILANAPKDVLKNASLLSPSLIVQGVCATPRKTKSAAQMCIDNIGPTPSYALPYNAPATIPDAN